MKSQLIFLNFTEISKTPFGLIDFAHYLINIIIFGVLANCGLPWQVGTVLQKKHMMYRRIAHDDLLRLASPAGRLLPSRWIDQKNNFHRQRDK